MNVGEWIHVTFADRDAHGPADCLAIFKLRHDNEHATEGGQSQPSRDMEQENTQTTTKKEDKSIKMWQLGKLKNIDTKQTASDTHGTNLKSHLHMGEKSKSGLEWIPEKKIPCWVRLGDSGLPFET